MMELIRVQDSDQSTGEGNRFLYAMRSSPVLNAVNDYNTVNHYNYLRKKSMGISMVLIQTLKPDPQTKPSKTPKKREPDPQSDQTLKTLGKPSKSLIIPQMLRATHSHRSIRSILRL